MMNPIVHTTKPAPDSMPGFWEPKVIPDLDRGIEKRNLNDMDPSSAFILENVLSAKDCETLVDFMNSSDNFEEVGVQGMKDAKDERIGSLRTSIWSPGVSEVIWNKIAQHMTLVFCHNKVATDWWQGLHTEELYNPGVTYVPVAVSPLLRFMKYEKGGQHYAHYDAGFIYPDDKYRTLQSVVIYLTTNEGAATRFVDDGQGDVDIWSRTHTDWDRPVKEHEIIAKSECIQGNILIFNHRICHDVEQYLGDQKRIIIRGDIVFERMG